MSNSPSLERLLARAEAVLARFEASLPPFQQAPDWQSAVAFRWRKSNGRGWLQAVRHPEKFIIFCDDLSFEAGETAYKALKSVLDGSIAAPPDNVLIYATSNRRHLMPEYFSENLETHRVDDEIHPGETTEEKISLSERFGLWISFYPFSQDDYLAIANHWARQLGVADEVIAASEREALNWALSRGSRSGRVAWQFARDLAGRQKTSRKKAK
jgi:hypothetical protein